MKRQPTDLLASLSKSVKRMFAPKTGRTARQTTRLAVEPLEDRSLLAASFFAPMDPSGTLNLQLVPLANVAAGTQEIVTFGMPFTRGSVTQAQLSLIRVLKNGVEIPAFVEQLTPWRSIDNPSLDGQSVRVARIQIPYTFTVLAPETITVQWGGPRRTLNRPTLQDPRLEWHTVTSGTFVAADNVEEPDVLPLLPKEYLAKGMLDSRTQPTANAVAETRDDPAVMDSMTFNGYDEFDYAQKNFFYTIINQNPGITIDYKTQAEPWLYDRSSGMYELYLRSGFGTALREAVRGADFYVDHLNTSGFFTLKAGDAKYAYNENLAYTYWLLGDNKMLAPISTVVNAHSGTQSHWSPTLSFFTERNVGYKLLANDIAYEVTGNATYKNNVQTIVNDLIWHQNGAGGQLPSNRIDGGLYHFGWQHDASEVDDPNVIIGSSWMSALVVDPMVRAYGLTESSQIADFIVRMGNFEKVASKTDANGQFGGTTRYPDYLMRVDGTSENRSDTDVQHAMDVGGVAAWATYFAELRGTPDASLRTLANNLYATYDVGVNFWTRPGGTNFNVSPPRRYTWEYKNSPSFSWALTGSDAPGQSGALQFSAATYSVNENQSSIAITVTRTGGSTGTVSVNYATSNGTATAGSDYTSSSGTLTFLNGETSKTFTVPIINDTLVENNETVNLTLSNPTGGATLGNQNTAVLTIQDDDVASQPGSLQFSNPTYTVNENGGFATITVTRTNGSDGAVSVNYATSNGSATAGSDYTSSNGTLTFANGQTSKTFNVPIINDTLVENNETVNLTLSSPTGGATLGSQNTAVLTIISDDLPQPGALQFSSIAYAVNENGGMATITVTRTGGSDGSVTVNYATSNGTATAGSDYTTTNGTLTFANGQISKTFTVAIINDSTAENPETVFLTLSNPTGGATLGSPVTATLTINDDDGQQSSVTFQQGVNGYTGTTDVSISTQYTQYTEGNGNTYFTATDLNVYQTTGTGSYTMESLIRFSNLGIPTNATVTSASLTVQVYTWSANPTVRGYYIQAPWSGTPGPNSNQLGWLHRGTGQNWAVPGARGQGNDVLAGKSFVLPGIAGNGAQTITVNLDPAVVQSWINNPSADQGVLLINETPGAIVRINASENSLVSSRPKLSINYTTGNPPAGTFQFSSPTYAVNENGVFATISVTRTSGSAGSVTVNYATSNGTATAGSDYTTSNGTLTFVNGETSKTFTVPIINDTLFEGNETINLALSNPTGGASLGSQNTAVLTIQDDDVAGQPGALQFSASSYSLLENGGVLAVTVTRTGGTSGSVSVQYATSNGTATAGSDYTSASGTLTFANGEASKTFNIAVSDDTLVEGNETVNLTLSNPTGGATLGNPSTATFTIVDNDSSGILLPPGFTQTTVATGLSSETALAAAPDGRIFVLEQGGAVRVIKNGTLLTTPAFTVTTIAEQERGLLGITFDPNFLTNHFVYVYYTVGGPSPAPAHNRVSRFTLIGDVAVPGSEMVLIDLPDVSNRIHNGGALKFGSDGKLYIAVGNDNVFGNSQSLANPFGKMLRINPDGTIPADNPFLSQTTGVNRAIWAIGLRNPYTFDVQPGTGLMYINDVGEAAWEEINQGAAGANYGWPDNEGYTTNPLYNSPVYAYAHGSGLDKGFAIVGAAFYNPATVTFPSQYVGKYFFMDFVNGWIDFVDPTVSNPKTSTNFASNIPTNFAGGPVDLEVGTDGALYYLNRLGGGVFKIQFNAQAPTITQQPSSQTVTLGQPVSFTVAASSVLPITFQWQKMDSGTTVWVNLNGATSTSYTISGTTMADNGDQFRCVVSNSVGSTNSNAATLTVTSPPSGTFTNVTIASGIGAIIAEKYQQTPDWWLSGEHLVDLDNDGDLDLYLSNHGGGSVVALNNGNGVFTRLNTGSFPDPEIHQIYDINEDGKLDLSMTYQDGGGRWWINNSTPGAVNFTATNTTRGGNTSRSQVMIDFNRDGKVDWLRSAPPGLVVDFGNGSGGFTEGSLSFAIPGTSSNENASFLPADFDGDGEIDLLILTGGGYDGTIGKTAYWRNNGNLTFTDITVAAGIPANGTIARGIGDFDQDGDTDFIAIENKTMPPVIYLNNGQGVFTKKTGAISGMGSGTLDYSAWGTAVSTDFDNDGIVDIIMDGKYFLKVLRGTGNGNFTYMNAAWGIKDAAAASVDDGMCFGDFDHDGDLDIIGYNETWPTRTLNVYRNDLAPKNYLNVRTVGLAGNKGAAGAKISIYAAGTNQLLWYEQVATYDFQVATSYYGFGETERHFGLGTRASVDVTVQFYGSGRVTRMNNVAANQTIRVLESDGAEPAMVGQAPDDVVWASYGTKTKLSNKELKEMERMAIDRWVAAGANRKQFAGVRIAQADLPNGMLGRQKGKLIEIDYNASGYGWFVDTTPRDDSEYTGATRPVGVDLLSVMSHELGHVLGLDHDDPGMSETLAPGTRLVPTAVTANGMKAGRHNK